MEVNGFLERKKKKKKTPCSIYVYLLVFYIYTHYTEYSIRIKMANILLFIHRLRGEVN